MRQDHVFVLDCDRYFNEDMLKELQSEESSRANRFLVAKTRRQYVVAHWLKGRILSFYADRHPNELKYERNAYGKPCLLGTEFPLHFNLSHTDSGVALAISATDAVGVDIETQRTPLDLPSLVDFTFHPLERARRSDEAIDAELFYRYWTLKEAATKAIGRGLSLAFNSMQLLHTAKDRYHYIDDTGTTWALRYTRLNDRLHLTCCSKGSFASFRQVHLQVVESLTRL